MTTTEYAEQQGVSLRTLYDLAQRKRIRLRPLTEDAIAALDDAFATWHASNLEADLHTTARAFNYEYGSQADHD